MIASDRIRRAAVAIGLAVGLAACGAPTDAPPSAVLVPCTDDGAPEDALCGTVDVWEDRVAATGRRISLHVVVLPALGPDRAPDPIFFFAGGPGGAATRRAAGFARRHDLRAKRDIVLIDQRGTGRSNPLDCDLDVSDDPADEELPEMFPVDKVRACREDLEQRADLTRYTSWIAVDDVDEVRRRLRYGRINLLGGSYGSRTVQLYMQRHPDAVRSAAMRGVMPLDHSPLQEQAPNAQETLDRFLDACAQDAECGETFPDLATRLDGLLDELSVPRRIEITDPSTGQPRPFTLSSALLGEGIRTLLYDLWAARALPFALDRAARGDFEPIAQLILLDETGWGALAEGMLLTVYCGEDLPSFDVDEAIRRAERTIFGSYRIRQQVGACSEWPQAPMPEDVGRPLASDVPTLLVSGELDPVNPARYGDRILEGLPRGLHLVVPEAHHGLSGVTDPQCVTDRVAEFLDRGTTDGLDTTCVERMRREPFLIERGSFDALVREWVDWLG